MPILHSDDRKSRGDELAVRFATLRGPQCCFANWHAFWLRCFLDQGEADSTIATHDPLGRAGVSDCVISPRGPTKRPTTGSN